MKKIMFILTFICAGLFANASINVPQATNKKISKLDATILCKAESKTYDDLCLMFEIWTTECPDGSVGILAVDAYVVDCGSGSPIVGATIISNDQEEACGN